MHGSRRRPVASDESLEYLCGPAGSSKRFAELPLVDERTPDDPVRFERVDLLRIETELGEELDVVLTQQRCVSNVHRARAAREPHGQRAAPGGPRDRVVDL